MGGVTTEDKDVNILYNRNLQWSEDCSTNHWTVVTNIFPESEVTILKSIFLCLKTFACHPYMS